MENRVEVMNPQRPTFLPNRQADVKRRENQLLNLQARYQERKLIKIIRGAQAMYIGKKRLAQQSPEREKLIRHLCPHNQEMILGKIIRQAHDMCTGRTMLACYNATVAKVQTPVVEPDRFNPEDPNSQDNGEKYIPQGMLAQRKARQDKTEQFPCHLLQTRESWNPQKASNYQTATDEAVPRVLDQLIQAQEVVKARRIGNPTETVTLANRSQRQTRFKPGDLVVVSNPTRHIGEMDELIHIFKEPCEVVSKTSQGHYQVEGTTRDNEIIFETVHGSRLIPYYPRV